MLGQGSPKPPVTLPAPANRRLVLGCILALAAPLLCPASTVCAASLQMRLRLEWGGDSPRQWQGRIYARGGTLSDPRPLGIEADEPGSMWTAGGVLEVRQRSPRFYDGVDVNVSAPSESTLVIDLRAVEGQVRLAEVEVPLEVLRHGSHDSQLDEQGNRLSVRRAPGDSLRVRLSSASAVFAPGDLLELEVQPHLLAIEAQARMRLAARLTPARATRNVWSDEVEMTAPTDAQDWSPVTLTVKLPSEEGAYDLHLEATRRSLTDRLGLRQVIDQRKVQIVVVVPTPPARPPAGKSPPLDLLAEIDPASPAWWDRLKKSFPPLPGIRRGPLGSGGSSLWQHPLGPLVQLADAAAEPNVAWEAYPLPVGKPGHVHLVDIELPPDVSQNLGISIIEPNALGQVLPIGLDSGAYQTAATQAGQPAADGWARHRLVFWPRTDSPLLLLTGRQPGTRAAYGKIRLYGPRSSVLVPFSRAAPPTIGLPRALAAGYEAGARLIAGYYDRPLFVENFSATLVSDERGGAASRCRDDWQTFLEGGGRLVEYLTYAGYNGLLLTVLADGSTIYPSERLEPTPKFDDGVFFSSGQDPTKKDVLELLFRLCDREQLRLVPAVQLAAPMPELEALRREGGSDAAGLEVIGVDGRSWTSLHPPRHGLAPYYNILHPRVQQAVSTVVDELAQRYGHHPSFGGVALRLDAEGYTQLPGLEWGCDAATLARFARDVALDLDEQAAGTSPAAARVVDRHREAWLSWRTEQLHRFHQQLQTGLAARKPEAQLYLVTAHLFDRPDLLSQLQPGLSRGLSFQQALLASGLDPRRYDRTPGIVWIRPYQVSPRRSVTAQGVELELNQSDQLDQLLAAGSAPAALCYHPPQQLRLSSFDAQSPFSSTYTRLVTQALPAGAENRRRFVHALATMDAAAVFDGGWLLPLGQEDSLGELFAAYRSLPAAAFKTVAGQYEPVTVRTLARGGRTFFYAVNDSPWNVTLALRVTGPADCRVEGLPAATRLPPLPAMSRSEAWTLTLGPFDLLAGVFNSGAVELAEPAVQLDTSVAQALEERIADLSARAAALQQPHVLGRLVNPGFETARGSSSAPDGWQVTAGDGGEATIVELPAPHGGSRSVHLRCRQGTAALVSPPLAPPETGRVAVSVWLRLSDPSRQPPLRLAIEGEHFGQPYYRYAVVGQGAAAPAIGASWGEYVFQVPDLPVEGLQWLRVRFDLMGPGEVWIDDVELRDLYFSDKERLELFKPVTLARFKLQRGELGECARLLDGYWPQYLLHYVEPAPAALAERSPSGNAPAAPAEPPAPGGLLDRVRRTLPAFWR